MSTPPPPNVPDAYAPLDGEPTRPIPTSAPGEEYRWSLETGYRTGGAPSVRAHQPSGAAYRPDGSAYEPHGRGALPQPHGTVYQPYGAVYQPHGTAYQPHGTAYQPHASFQPVRQTDGMAVGALVVGLVSLLVGWVPFVNVLSIVGGIVAAVLGVVALRRIGRDSTGGKGMAIGGIVLGVLSLIVSILMSVLIGWISSSMVGGGFADPFSEEWDSTPPEGRPVDPATMLPLGQSAQLGDYTVTVTGVNTNANEVIAAVDESNLPPENQYVLADVTIVYTGGTQGDAWNDLEHALQAADGTRYYWYECYATEPNPFIDIPVLEPGQTASYSVCFDAPPEAIAGSSVAVETFASAVDDGRSDWAVP